MCSLFSDEVLNILMESPTWNLLWEAQLLKVLVSLEGGTTHPFGPPTWNSSWEEATEEHCSIWPKKMAKRSTSRVVVKVEFIEKVEEAIARGE